MDQLDVLDIAAGVLAGNLMTFVFIMCLREADRQERQISKISGWALLGMILPLLYLAASVYLSSAP